MVKPREILTTFDIKDSSKKTNWRLKLDDNENVYACASSVLSVIKNLKNLDISQYPKYDNLLEKFEAKYHKNKNNFLFLNGRNEAYSAFLNAYLDKKDEILISKSVEEIFGFAIKALDTKVRYYDFDDDYNINITHIKEKISLNTKIIYISTPDEITGKTIRPSMLEQIIEENPDILFVLDCTYADYSFDVCLEDYYDLAFKYNNVAILKSFSKLMGLAGVRFCVVFSCLDVIRNIKKVVPKYSVNSIALACVLMILSDEKYIQEVKELNFKAKELLFEELNKRGFLAIKSETNSILCDFSSSCEFYYNKLKNNGVITKKFTPNSSFSNCIRITIPTLGGVRFISEVLNKKEILAFELDNVLFDVQNSYNKALSLVYFKFLNKEIEYDEIYETKKLNAISCDIETLRFLFKKEGIELSFEDILNEYKNFFYNSENKTALNLIDEQELLISKETLEELSKKYDLVVFSNRFKDEINYLFEKFDIGKYFNFVVSFDDIENSMYKPHPFGIKKIINYCPNKKIIYFGSCADDIISGNLANIETVGIMYPNCDYNKMMNNYRHLGATHILENIEHIEDFLLNLKN